MPLTPALCVIQIIGTDFLRTSSTDPTLYNCRIQFQASCLDEDGYLVAYQVDEEGVPTQYYYENYVTLAGDETQTSKRDKLSAAALAAFDSITVPVLFVV